MRINTYRGYRRSNPIMSGCAASLVGMLFAGIGIFLSLDTLRFLSGTVSTHGTITQCNFSEDSEGKSGCQPVVSFTTQAGQQITFSSSFSSSFFHEGDGVTVRYHPGNPHDARVDSFIETWMFPLVFAGFGLLALLLGLRGFLRAYI